MRSHHPANLISSDVHRNRIPSGPEKMTRSCQSHTQSWHSLPSTDLNCISVIIPSSCILKSRTKLQVRIASSILGIDFLWQSILLLHVCLANNCSGLTDGLSRYSGQWLLGDDSDAKILQYGVHSSYYIIYTHLPLQLDCLFVSRLIRQENIACTILQSMCVTHKERVNNKQSIPKLLWLLCVSGPFSVRCNGCNGRLHFFLGHISYLLWVCL